MNKQPEALRLADLWDGKAKDLQTWVDENDYVEFGYRPEGLKKEQQDQFEVAAELRRLHDLLGKANALCRLRQDGIAALQEKVKSLHEEVLTLRDSCEAKAERIDRLGEMVERLTKEKK